MTTATGTPACHVLAELESMEHKRRVDREVRRCIPLLSRVRDKSAQSAGALDDDTRNYLVQEWRILTQLHPRQALTLMQVWRLAATEALAGRSPFAEVHPDICLD